MFRKTLFFLCIGFTSFGQELNARVEMNYQQMKSSINYAPNLFEDMQSQIEQFMNNTRWSNDDFEQEEKINCSLIVTLTQSTTQNVFVGTAQFQVTRPVFGTDYESVTLQYVDREFSFSYQPTERQMVFNEQSFTSNITALSAYYSLMAMAIDYDSFGNLGGSSYIQRLFDLVSLAGRGGGGGWSQSQNTQRNRYWLVENLQNLQMKGFRESFYKYHRLVLDDLGREPEKGRAEILKILEIIQNIVILKPNSILINSFFDAKAPELINLFSVGDASEKQKAFLLLSGLDPDKTEAYRKIISGR
ncbi:MAG: hypothetical protein ACI9IP_000370 [Arcticibacterium sp.]|jgi:hypothetical protein